MNDRLYEFLLIDLMPLLAVTLAALACGLIGNVLVLRRMSMMGDAISHAVLPGLVAGFLVAQSRATFPMFVGAGVAGLATVALTGLVRRYGRVEPGDAMGVVFTVLFALGVVLIDSGPARHQDLDAECVLFGQAESIGWFPPSDLDGFLSIDTVLGTPGDSGERVGGVPRQAWTLFGAALGSILLLVVLHKEIKLVCFDPLLASSLGFSAPLLTGVLMVAVAGMAVAAFEAVGSILVIAMLVCPAATSRLLTDRYARQLVFSGVIALASGAGGYVLGAWLNVSIAGAVACVAGLVLALAAVASPTHGVLSKAIRRHALAMRTALDDVIGTVYRAEESGVGGATLDALYAMLGRRDVGVRAVRTARARGLIAIEGGLARLTEAGRARGVQLVRRHRLWEDYLVGRAGLRVDHVHDLAHQLEHLKVAPAGDGARTDPHGKPIP